MVSCAAGQTNCGGTCRDLTTDVNNCGACATACAAGEVCMASACAASCGAGLTACSGACRATQIDPINCGTCGTICPARANAAPVCVTGTCNFVCNANFANCDGDPLNGCETNLLSSPTSCGRCANVCTGGTTCVAGVCATSSGVDGALMLASGTTTINTVRTTVTGTAASTMATLGDATGFAVGNLVLLHQSQGGTTVGAWETHRIVTLAGTSVTLDTPLANTYEVSATAHAQIVLVPQYTTVSVAGATLNAPAWDGTTGGILAFVAGGAVTVNAGGVIDMGARGFRGHPFLMIPNRPGDQGEGSTAFGIQTRAANTNGGGGGERNGCECCWGGAGGGGGHALAGTAGNNGGNPCQLGGLGGLAVGNPNQTLVFFGGAGANGGADEDGYGSGGASGGGFVYIGAASITMIGTGRLSVDGQTGRPDVNFSGCGSGGGGGGAGGAIYLQTAVVDLGASRVTSAGGVGGDDPGNCGTPGGVGSVGRITIRGGSMVAGASAPAATIVP